MRRRAICAAIVATVTLIPLSARAISLQVNEDGFGNRYNEYAWAMKSFDDYLYVGTQNPAEGGEIWRYRPELGWEQLLEGGLGNPGNMGVRTFVEFNGHLYASTNNHDTGGEIWRQSEDTRGVVWERVIEPGFGNCDNTSIRGLKVFDGQLYAGTYNFPTGCEVWRSPDGIDWEQLLEGGFGSANNFAAAVMEEQAGKLYVGTWNIQEGLEVWRWSDTDGWELTNEHGFGDVNNWNAVGISKYKGRIYVGTGNVWGGAEVWCFDAEEGWEKVGPGGFGNPWNSYHWYMETYRGKLYVGTLNLKWFGLQGHELWSYHDVQGWTQVAAHGFGERNNYGLRTMAEYRGDLYIGIANTLPEPWIAEGCEVWRYDEEMIHANCYPMPRKAAMDKAFFFGRFLRMELILPCGYDMADIDKESMRIIRVNDTSADVGAGFYYTFRNRRFILFPRDAVEPLLTVGQNQIYVEGMHGSGEEFGGVGQMIIDPD